MGSPSAHSTYQLYAAICCEWTWASLQMTGKARRELHVDGMRKRGISSFLTRSELELQLTGTGMRERGISSFLTTHNRFSGAGLKAGCTSSVLCRPCPPLESRFLPWVHSPSAGLGYRMRTSLARHCRSCAYPQSCPHGSSLVPLRRLPSPCAPCIVSHQLQADVTHPLLAEKVCRRHMQSRPITHKRSRSASVPTSL